jgi:hypothetical protein
VKAGLAFTGRTHVSTLYESIYHDCGIEDAEADENPRRHTVDKAWSGWYVLVGGKVNHELPFHMNRHSMT